MHEHHGRLYSSLFLLIFCIGTSIVLLGLDPGVATGQSGDLTSTAYVHTASSTYPSGAFHPSYVSDNRTGLYNGTWHSKDIRQGYTFPHWVSIDFDTDAPAVMVLRLLAYADGAGVRLKYFFFEGSNDGVNFVPLHAGTMIYANSHTWQTFEFTNSTSYRHYRLRGLNNWTSQELGSSQMIIEEWEMFGVALGACCLNNGTACEVATMDGCSEAGGEFAGPGTECPAVNASIIDEPGGVVFVHVIAPPIVCGDSLAGKWRDEPCPPGGPYFDAWVSDQDSLMCHYFGVEGSPAIPADFFEPGSEPFTGAVCLHGVPFNEQEYGDADTIIERTDDPFDRCTLPTADPVTVDIWIIALSLESNEPITVITNSEPVLWNLAVDLSEVSAPVGSLTATKTHCNGGTYTSTLHVQPRFTFTMVDDPGEVRVLDTGLVGTPFVTLDQQDPLEWACDVGVMEGGIDPCTDFHPAFETAEPQTECDCDGNEQRDLCDIEDGLFGDCNENGIPDSCDIVSGVSLDANANGVPDECDVGVCCTPEGYCLTTFEDGCLDDWLGLDTTCDPNPCVPAGVANRDQPPTAFLSEAQPNPFIRSTAIRFGLARPGEVSLSVFDASGRLVRTLAEGVRPPGEHVVTWAGQDDLGNRLTSGIYFYRLMVDGKPVGTEKVVVLR